MSIKWFWTTLGLAYLSAAAAALSSRSSDGTEFVYEQAYRVRIAKNADFSEYTDGDYARILPGLPASDSQKSPWWFGYKSAGSPFRNIAVAQRKVGPIFYEQEVHFDTGSSTWQAYTDNERWFRLSWKAQYLDEFDPDYPAEHNVFVNKDGDLALGAPAPTQPPSVWGKAPGTYLVCQREFQHQDVLAIRFAYTVLNETQNIPEGCVPVKLESRCAPLQPLKHNETWNHEEIIDSPCVKDKYSLKKRFL